MCGKREAAVFASFCLKSGDDRGLRLLYRAKKILLAISSVPHTNNTSHFGQSLLSSRFNVTPHKVGFAVSRVYTTYVCLPASSLCKLDKACEHDCANHHSGAYVCVCGFLGGAEGVKQNALPRFFGRPSELEKPQAISAQSSLFRSFGLARLLLLYISPSALMLFFGSVFEFWG